MEKCSTNDCSMKSTIQKTETKVDEMHKLICGNGAAGLAELQRNNKGEIERHKKSHAKFYALFIALLGWVGFDTIMRWLNG